MNRLKIIKRKARKEDECIVSGAIAIALCVSRFAGFAPLRFQRINSGTFRVTLSRKAAFISGIAITLLRLSLFSITLSDLTLAQIRKSLALDSKSSVLLFFTDVVLTMSATSIGVFGGQCRMRRFFRILTLVQQINMETEYDAHFEPRPWKVWAGFLGAIFCGYSLILFNLFIFIIRNGGEKSMALIFMYAFYFETALVIFLIMQDAILFNTVYSTTKAINARIGNQLKSNSLMQPSNLVTKELEVVQHFLSICNILELISQSEGILLLLLICGLVLYIFVTVYYLALNLLFSDISLESVLQVISQALWLVLHSFKLIVMIEPCHQLHQEMKNSKYLLSRLLSHSRKEREELHSYPSPARREPLGNVTLSLEIPSFSPMGLVVFGRPLLATIAGAVTTFFIIVTQFNFKLK